MFSETQLSDPHYRLYLDHKRSQVRDHKRTGFLFKI